MNQETMTMRIFVPADNDAQCSVPFDLSFEASRLDRVCEMSALLVNASDVYLAEEMGEWAITE